MLGYSSEELLTTQFKDLVIREKSQLALTDMIFDEKGAVVIFNGKVVIHCFSHCPQNKILNASCFVLD